MPVLVDPALPAGTLRDLEQPHLTVDEELVLRPWSAADAPMVQTAFSCPDIQRWHVRRLDTPEEAVEWTAQWQSRWAADEAASWAVVDSDNEPLGQVGLRSISLTEASAGVSYWVLPAARGRGLAARAVRSMQVWAFGELGFNRLDIQHSTRNEASCKVAGKTGFALEGTLRQAIQHADGWHDWHVHGRIRSDG
ncbi:GNAT family N-acetyltransferase [Streptomyces sp. SID13031]|uniref:GNAT family N-acetyltransferase n=1 Tax=Streptomyces sp. SID13031 TaxID=2706046 RepID=UPI0013CBC415|nr:GNAT family N-acetyltransferase [Streptomyces sp. SID13031]NEA35759.1 GNAT family N-acetyltransferase [Streptomyces sp. SID13031]